jgi:hypothetical protein
MFLSTLRVFTLALAWTGAPETPPTTPQVAPPSALQLAERVTREADEPRKKASLKVALAKGVDLKPLFAGGNLGVALAWRF